MNLEKPATIMFSIGNELEKKNYYVMSLVEIYLIILMMQISIAPNYFGITGGYDSIVHK